MSGREEIIAYLKQQLMGPVFGPEEVIPDVPFEYYTVAVLFPSKVEEDSIEEETEGFDADGEQEDPIPLSGQLKPSSMGLSCVVDVDQVRIELKAAQYSFVDSRWHRKPISAAFNLSRDDPNTLHFVPGVNLEVVSRWRAASVAGQSNLTVAVVNRSASVADQGKAAIAASCFYQVSFTVIPKGGFLHPASGVEEPELNTEEEDELAFRYRNRISYGVGHGCAVSWPSDEQPPSKISTDSIPAYTVPTLAAREGDQPWLGAWWLANMDMEKVGQLGELVDEYSEAIEKMKLETVAHGAREAAAMTRLAERMEEARDRMRLGVKTLQSDPNALEAFRRANRAMVEQRWSSDQVGQLKGRLRKPVEKINQLPEDDELAGFRFRWRPFQLGFALMLVEALTNGESEWHEIVDLIWFPTGGGKTEAYLLVASYIAVLRRLRDSVRGAGTAILSRYTLRLLTAQQFQRSCTLFCALERSRRREPNLLGQSPFEIGLYIGQDSTPNKCQAALNLVEEGHVTPESSPFSLRQCPWCGTSLLPDHAGGVHGFKPSNNDFYFACRHPECEFKDRLPVQVIDEVLYDKPPTMVLAVVDKFAVLPREPRLARFLGADSRYQPLSLIIQDELHLLGAALGTVFGVYESAVDVICRHFSNGKGPKIVASTATTRDSTRQVANLFGRPVQVFPPAGMTEEENYFSEAQQYPGRTYVGVLSPHHSPSMSLIRISALLAQSVEHLDLSVEERDAYWTNVIYHNSLRLLGKTLVFASDDIPDWIGKYSAAAPRSRQLNISQVEQMTSNVQNWDIPKILERLFTPASKSDEALAILCATNMISVGVDVPRLGLMLVHGQPNGTSEYIQASSRVGRQTSHPGLVIAHYSKTKTRDTSHYETFRSYHHALYRYVEPTSVTPLALPARRRALPAALIGAIRAVHGLTENDHAGRASFQSPAYKETVALLNERLEATGDPDQEAGRKHLDELINDWDGRCSPQLVFDSPDRKLDSLICDFGQPRGHAWPCGRSFRNVDVACDVGVGGRG
jgi:hypothetical protein